MQNSGSYNPQRLLVVEKRRRWRNQRPVSSDRLFRI